MGRAEHPATEGRPAVPHGGGGTVGVLIIVLGVVGIGVALAAIIETAVDAARTRRVLDLFAIVAVAALTVWLLVAYGDVIMQ